MFVAAQIAGGFAIAVLLAYSIVKVTSRTILFCNIVINLLWAVHYLLLGAYTGCACSLLFTLMVTVYFFKNSCRFLSGIHIPLIFAAVFILFGALTWEGTSSFLPIVINLILTAAMWMDREIVIKGMCIPVAAMWVVYNCFYLSYIGIIGQALSFLFHSIYVIMYIGRKKREEKPREDT